MPVSLPFEVNWVCALLLLGDSVLSILFHFSTLLPCGRAAPVHHHIQALTRPKSTEEKEEGKEWHCRRKIKCKVYCERRQMEDFGYEKNNNNQSTGVMSCTVAAWSSVILRAHSNLSAEDAPSVASQHFHSTKWISTRFIHVSGFKEKREKRKGDKRRERKRQRLRWMREIKLSLNQRLEELQGSRARFEVFACVFCVRVFQWACAGGI